MLTQLRVIKPKSLCLAALGSQLKIEIPHFAFSRNFSKSISENKKDQSNSFVSSKEQIREMIKQASGDLKKMADEGDAESQSSYGEFLESGKIGNSDLAEAVHYYKLSADQKCASGLLNYGRALIQGIGIKKDEKLGLHYVNAAAGQDYGPAQLFLGNLYFDGTDHIKKNHIMSARYFKLAADKGIKSAQNSIAFMLLNGDGIDKNEEQAMEYLKKSAEQGDAQGQANYAKALAENPNDIKQAIEYFERAAKNGSIDAFIGLASLYSAGKGVQRDMNKALSYAKQAADTNDPRGHMLYGYILEQDQKFDQAFIEYKKAADNGEVTSMGNIARLYQFGLGCKVDIKKALHYFKMAADKGDPNSANSYAFLLQKGQNGAGKRDINEIIKYYNISVKAKHTVAMNNLGILYLKGDQLSGLKPKPEEAIKLFKMAADNGNPSGFLNIGFMYEKGVGRKKDLAEAKKFYQLAAEKGDPFAARLLTKLK